MPDRPTRSYPPVGAPDRLDQIVRRGRSLRRRRRAGMAAAGTGGTLAVVALVMAAFTVFGSGGSDDGVVADDPEPTVVTTTSSTTTVLALEPGELGVAVKDGPPVQVEVRDPEQPVGEGTQQCLEVAVFPAGSSRESVPVFRGQGCRPGTGTEFLDIELLPAPPDGSDLMACAPALERPSATTPEDPETASGTTTFTLGELPTGEYRLLLEANSGIGDGCGPPEEWEQEHHRTLERSVTMPAGSD